MEERLAVQAVLVVQELRREPPRGLFRGVLAVQFDPAVPEEISSRLCSGTVSGALVLVAVVSDLV